MLKLAVPATRFLGPRMVFPSSELTVPVGMPVPDTGFTRAWKLTD